jgi:hypothetical protein
VWTFLHVSSRRRPPPFLLFVSVSPRIARSLFTPLHWAALTDILLASLYAFSPINTSSSAATDTSSPSASSTSSASASASYSALSAARECVCVSLAADILSRGARLWTTAHVADVPLLLRSLFALARHRAPPVAAAAARALLECARVHGRFFVACVSAHAQHAKSADAHRAAALSALVAVARKYPAALVAELPACIETVARCLDPSHAGVRQALLAASTQALFTMVQRFPMTAFHQVRGGGVAAAEGKGGNWGWFVFLSLVEL